MRRPNATRKMIRKEKPLPPARPPTRPPSPSGIKAPGETAKPSGMICPGTDHR
jgi:hypothetical protein